ncbi:hypothetical protein FRC12_023143 [Ceratobasidium sp. 428]|nr:hypothetical protein FRC12_023143 [Ceratobasidium sp. 428]
MQKKPGLLRRTGSIASGNNVKFAPAVETSKKRKAESEPAEESHDSDVDAEGETEEGYEDVEEDEEPKPVSKSRPSKPGPSKPMKRPRRSMSARKMPTKVPEVLIDSRAPKKRRLRR